MSILFGARSFPRMPRRRPRSKVVGGFGSTVVNLVTGATQMERDLIGLIERWHTRTRMAEQEHFAQCKAFRRLHVILGCITIVCTTLLGVSSNLVSNHISLEIPFPAGNSSFDLVRDATMLLTIIAPVLTAVLSFLRFDEKSGMHHNAGARFASMKRRLHLMISECNSGCDPDKVKTELKKICEKWDALTLQAPALYLNEKAFNEASDEAPRARRTARRPEPSLQVVGSNMAPAEAASA